MSDAWILFFLLICIAFLFGMILYQRFAFRTGVQAELLEICRQLKRINDTDGGGGVMVFTDHKAVMELAAQVNRLLENHLRVKAGYRRSEIASKKMLSNISHDMKTPMTVILGYLEIMSIHGASDEMLKKTEQRAKGVMELIDQFFTLAKIESGDMELAISKIDICEVCRESILDFYELLTKNGFQVEIEIPEKPFYVQGNEDALQRILFNLISNVIRYGSDGKYLGIFVREDERSVFVDVVDKGKGIDSSFADSIFDRLFTMEDSRNRKIQGNGLGLSIAKNLALRISGDILLKSIPYERTVFSVRLKKIAFEI